MREEPSQSDLFDYSGGSAGDEENAAGGDDTDVDGDEHGSAESGPDSPDGPDGSDGETDAGDTADTLPDASRVDPATPTYRWVPEGAACDSCGSVVTRRWVDGDGGDDSDAPAFVCDDCKEW